jgi:hypothetical protein
MGCEKLERQLDEAQREIEEIKKLRFIRCVDEHDILVVPTGFDMEVVRSIKNPCHGHRVMTDVEYDSRLAAAESLLESAGAYLLLSEIPNEIVEEWHTEYKAYKDSNK